MTPSVDGRFADDAQRYRLDSRIATGGMGEVWRATDTVLGREVAVKLLKTEYADDAMFRSRFETEARHAAALHHSGVAAVYDVGEGTTSDGSGRPRPFLVMELVAGQPMSTLLADARTNGRRLDPDVVRDLMAQTGDALGAAHRAGIVHRDVKPANLMVTPDGVVKVTDFGIARAAEGVGITRTGAVMGTPQYLSPEQAEGRAATAASDVYSLGVVTFECLAGRRPFDAESPVATALAHIREPVPDLPARVPADLAAVVRRALDKDPTRHYPDGSAFAAALRDPATAAVRVPPVVPVPVPPPAATQVLGSVPYDPEPEPVVEPFAPVTTTTSTVTAAPRSPWPILAAVVLLVLLAVAVTLILTRGNGDSSPTGTDTTSATRTHRTPSSTPPSTTATTPSDVASIDPDDYRGRPVDDVAGELSDLGFRVTRNEVANDGTQTEGAVTDVNPSGDVSFDTPITVSYAGAVPETPTESDTPSEGTVPPSTSSTPSESASTPVPPTPPGGALTPPSGATP